MRLCVQLCVLHSCLDTSRLHTCYDRGPRISDFVWWSIKRLTAGLMCLCQLGRVYIGIIRVKLIIIANQCLQLL